MRLRAWGSHSFWFFRERWFFHLSPVLKDLSRCPVSRCGSGAVAFRVSFSEKREWDAFMRKRISFLFPHIQSSMPKQIDHEEIKLFQEGVKKPGNIKINEQTNLLCKNNKIWIPRPLIPRLLWYNHVSQGHPSLDEEITGLNEYYFEISKTELEKQLKQLHDRCLHCKKRPSIVRRPFLLTWRAEKPNQMIHADFLKIYKHYILVMLDNYSRKVELIPCEKATSTVVVNAILWWAARYGMRKQFLLVTDNASHFCSEIVDKLERTLGFKHRYSVAYSPWTHGVCEVMNRRVIDLFQILISEYGIHQKEWM